MKLPPAGPGVRRALGFTLLEVALAMLIFFAAVFVILEIVSGGLRIARQLQQPRFDMGAMAARVALTNQLFEGPIDGALFDDLLELYPGYSAEGEIALVLTNGLYEVTLRAWSPERGAEPVGEITLLLFRPESPTRAGGGAVPR
ncbi:MAG TPA: hypothetical protein PKE47_14545 [Verrucomicrobiota bacterium]|nr:hypothetical protein [Verrucomicrobiota bacterium]